MTGVASIAILGAGIVGITTAYELARSGYQVTVIEERSTPAEEASFAIPGLMGPVHAAVTAFNARPARFGRDFWASPSSIRLGRGIQSREWRWLWQWLRCSSQPGDAQRRQELAKLALYSGTLLAEVAHDHGWEFEQTHGYTCLVRTESELQEWQTWLESLKALGVNAQTLDETGVRRLEPALNPDTPVHAGIHFASESTANCRQVALLLKKECESLGVKFLFDHKVLPLKPGNATTLHVQPAGNAPASTLRFDGVVVCAGQGSGLLVADVCPHLPEIEVHGYSISSHIREPLNAPRYTCTDWTHQVQIARLGHRVRVAGIAELGQTTPSRRLATLRILYRVLLDWFPGACHMQQVQEWRGTRICTPDGLPILGATAEPGVWLNMAHGDNGWAFSLGCARALSQMLSMSSTLPSEVDWSQFSALRFA